jgi:aerobic-type carbon monoxide dehydrogenase small subunit (CoxS/CutS family)
MGKATIRMEFAYDGCGFGKGGTATIHVNGKKVASDQIGVLTVELKNMQKTNMDRADKAVREPFR